MSGTDEVLADEPGDAITATGAQRIPISLEVLGALPPDSAHERFVNAVLTATAELEPYFLSVADAPDLHDDDPDELFHDRRKIAQEAIEFEQAHPSKITPVITGADHETEGDLHAYAEMGVERVIISPPAEEIEGKAPPSYASTMNVLELARNMKVFKQIGVMLRAEPIPAATGSETEVNEWLMALRLEIADFGVTKFLAEPGPYVDLMNSMRARDVDKPIIPGLAPFANPLGEDAASYAARFRTPPQADMLERARVVEQKLGPQEQAADRLRAFAIGHTVELAQTLVREGAPSLHFYTRNHMGLTRQVVEALRAEEDR